MKHQHQHLDHTSSKYLKEGKKHAHTVNAAKNFLFLNFTLNYVDT